MANNTAKQKVIADFQTHDKDTGSADVQVALLSNKIDKLADHLKTHKKDKHSRRGLVKLVDQRRKHLNYLKDKKEAAYKAVTKKLGLKTK
jgi:small subunit ribosomal protein S15